MALGIKRNWFTEHNISCLLLAFLFLSETLNYYIFWMLMLGYVAYCIVQNKGIIRIKHQGSACIFTCMVVLGIFSAILSGFRDANSVGWWTYTRDLIRFFSVPLTFLLASQLSEQNDHDYCVLYTTLYFFCSIYGVGSLILSIPKYLATSESLFEYSQNLLNQWMIAVGVFLAFFKPKYVEACYINKTFDFCAKIGLVVLLAMSFSRTTFLILLCLLFPFVMRRFKEILKIGVVVMVIGLVIWSLFPTIANTFVDKMYRSFTEMASDSLSWNDSSIVSNWRGYEVYCAKQEYSKFDTIQMVIGKGFGATVDAHGYARLVTSEDTLPYLHNGYYTTLIKLGITGVALSMMYWAALYKERRKRLEQYERGICFGIVAALALSMLVIHGIFWGGAMLIPVLLLEW